jgi:hypothetical protein
MKLTATTPNLRHYVTNIQTEVNGDETRSPLFSPDDCNDQRGGTKVVIAGEYEDRLGKRDGRGLFL